MNNILGGVTTTPTAFKAIKEKITDQTYNPKSENAQSGLAVAEAISDVIVKTEQGGKVLGDTESKATAEFALAQGRGTEARTYASHTEGMFTYTEAQGSHAEGYESRTLRNWSHAEGYDTEAGGQHSHTEGAHTKTTFDGEGAHAEGGNTEASALYAHSEGRDTFAQAEAAHSEGIGTTARGVGSHSEGIATEAVGPHSHVEGVSCQTTVNGVGAHAEGGGTIASAEYAHTEGRETKASANNSHAEGYKTNAKKENAHSEGKQTTADGVAAHSEGIHTEALDEAAHSEGYGTHAQKAYSHAEGYNTTASEIAAHSEGILTVASGKGAHAEGGHTLAKGEHSHSEGLDTAARGNYSHAGGKGTITDENTEAQTAIGRYNDNTPGALLVVGDGGDISNRSNAFMVHERGYAEVRVVGESDNSVINKEYLERVLSTAGGDEVVTPKMYGAKADGKTCDADAIQAAINSGKSVVIQKGNYLITKPIIINSTINLNAEDSIITYSGNDYAVIINGFDNGTLRFGKIKSANGGCIKLDCTTNYIQYLNLYWEEMHSAATHNCVYCHTPNSDGVQWINEIHFFNGRFCSGATGIHADAHGKLQLNGFKFINVGIEGVDVGYYMANKVADWLIIGSRHAEIKEGKRLFKTVGEVYDVTYITAGSVGEWMLDFSENTHRFFIKGRIVRGENSYDYMGDDLHVLYGKLCVVNPNEPHTYKNLYNHTEYDTDTQTAFIVQKNFAYGGNDTTIKLSSAYGCHNGINEVCVFDTGGNNKKHTIIDHNNNIIVENRQLNYGEMAVYRYFSFGGTPKWFTIK